MKKMLVLLVLCVGCGGKLTEEQRKRLHDGMTTQDIKRVSEADLQEAAMSYAESVMADIVKVDESLNQKVRIDSLTRARKVRIYALSEAADGLDEIERQIVEAYAASSDPAGDNLQKTGGDSLLFTTPVYGEGPNGKSQFRYAIGIKMSKKTVVLSMPNP